MSLRGGRSFWSRAVGALARLVGLAAARVRARELRRELGAARLTTWMEVRLNSLARLIFLFVEATILVDRFCARLGGVLEIELRVWCWVARGFALYALGDEVRFWTRFGAENRSGCDCGPRKNAW